MNKALVRIDKLRIIDSLIKASQNGATVKIICPLSKQNSQIQKKMTDNAPDISILNGIKNRFPHAEKSEWFIRKLIGDRSSN